MTSNSGGVWIPFSSSMSYISSIDESPLRGITVHAFPSQWLHASGHRLDTLATFAPAPFDPALFLGTLLSCFPPMFDVLATSVDFPYKVPHP